MIAGFIVRRTMFPLFLHYLAYQPSRTPSPPTLEAPVPEETTAPPLAKEPSSAQTPGALAATPMARKSAVPPSEHLTESDQQQLEDILKRKTH